MKIYRLHIAIVLLLATASFMSCNQSEPAESAQAEVNTTLTYAMQNPWNTLMPYDTTSGVYTGLVVDKIYDKLVYVRADGSISPRAAKSWSISDDGKTITFILDENARWHDGEAVTAADWLYTLQAVSDSENTVPDRANMAILAGTDDSGIELSENSIGVEAPDDYTLVFHLKNVTNLESFLLTKNRMFVVLPKHLLEDVPAATWAEADFWSHPVGSGPFAFESQLSGSQLTLTANSDYQLGAPDVETLVMKVVSATNMATSLMTGDIDMVYPTLTTEDSELLQEEDGVTVVKSEVPTNLMFITINNNNIPDARIRRAINLAVNKELIVDSLLQGEAVPSESYISPANRYYNTNLETEYAPEQAKALLEEAGWDFSTPLTMAVPTGIREKIAVLIQQNLAEIGVELEITTVDAATMFSGVMKGDYDSCLVSYTAGLDPLYFDMMFDNNKVNLASISDPTYMELQNAIAVELDDDIRMDLVNEWQEFIDEQEPYVWLYHAYSFGTYSARLGNVHTQDAGNWNEASWEWTLAY